MSCTAIAVIVGGSIVALLVLACYFDHIVVAERRERSFQRWKQKQDRQSKEPSPPDDDP